MVEIQSKNWFLGTFLGVFGLQPLMPYDLRLNHPLDGWKTPSALPLCQHWSQTVRDYVKKIPTFIAFCKVLLSDVKIEILLFSWQFLVFRCTCHSPAHLFTPSFFGKQKVLRWYISGPSFIYFWLAVTKFSKFKCFYSSRKLDFRPPTSYVGGKRHSFPPLLRHHLSQIVKWH